MNYQQVLFKGSKFLKFNNVTNPYLDSELILSKILNIDRKKILINLKDKLCKKDLNKFNQYVLRRTKKEPIAYIIGYKYFWKYKFYVNKSVLIPRPETEQIVEETLNFFPKGKDINILDIGTGSGCVIISIIKERPKFKASAIDISSNAVKVAKTNAKLHHLQNKIKFINIDVDKFNTYKYDLIVSNPPYINKIKIKRLDDDVRLYEPKVALDGGLDG